MVYHALPKEPAHGNCIQYKGEGKYELFSLKQDPFESNNLVISNPDKVKAMVKGMLASLESKNAVYPNQNQELLKPKP